MSDQKLIVLVEGLREDVQALTHGLSIMLEVQAKHGTALERVEAAMSAEPGESPVAALLTQILSQLTAQTETLLRIEANAESSAPSPSPDTPAH